MLASSEHVFTGKLNYVAAAMDANTRRLVVRATIENPEKLLKPEMFASVTIFSGEEKTSPGARVRQSSMREMSLGSGSHPTTNRSDCAG